jgi:hypothetical protein
MNINNFEVVCKLGEDVSNNHIGIGTKVRCISDSDNQSNWGGNDSAKEFLKIGEIYTLSKEPEVHSWHTKYYLKEVLGKKFNSVQFEIVE